MLPALHAGPAPWTWVSGVQTPNNSSGLALQAVCVPLFTSPIARAVSRTDLSLPAGLFVSAAIYLLLMRHRVRV